MRTASAWQRAGIAGVAAMLAFGSGVLLRATPASEAADEVVAPVVRASHPPGSPAGATETTVSTASRLDPQVAFNPFGALNLGSPATLGQPAASVPRPKTVKPVAVTPPAPPPPIAPPLPFVAIGSLAGADVAQGEPVAFLQHQDQLLVVRAGQSLGSTYRVESITRQGIDFTYLPLMQRQTLPLAP